MPAAPAGLRWGMLNLPVLSKPAVVVAHTTVQTLLAPAVPVIGPRPRPHSARDTHSACGIPFDCNDALLALVGGTAGCLAQRLSGRPDADQDPHQWSAFSRLRIAGFRFEL